MAVGGGVGAALVAGCTTSDEAADGGGSGGSDDARFRLLVSDAPAAIDDFERLDVTFDSARVFERGAESDDEETTDADNETDIGDERQSDDEPTEDYQRNETDAESEATVTEMPTADDEAETEDPDEAPDSETEGAETPTATPDEDAGDENESADGEDGARGFYVLELDDAAVDLTEVVGDRAKPVFDGELSPGTYEKLELNVSDVEGIVGGEAAEVEVPSEKLQLTKPFEVEADGAVDFVFDINVVERGREASYILKPVVSESGVAGEDVEVEEVDEGDGDGDAENGTGGGESAEERGGEGDEEATENGTDGGETADGAEPGSGGDDAGTENETGE